jgi:hypothetical protein
MMQVHSCDGDVVVVPVTRYCDLLVNFIESVHDKPRQKVKMCCLADFDHARFHCQVVHKETSTIPVERNHGAGFTRIF